MMKSFTPALLVFFWVASCAAADAAPPAQRHARVTKTARGTRARRPADLDAFVRALRARGLKVEEAGEVSQPFFTLKGMAFTVGGENVQVFRYPGERAAESEAKQVNAEGTSVGTSSAMWVGPPHFYRKGRLVVLYVGDDAGVLKALTAALGPQFAGK